MVEAVDRIYRSDVPKTHAKCHYQVSYKTSSDVDTILLDVLTEDNNYHAVESLPIKSPFLLTEGPDVLVKVPCKADLLGDKLTAFAPHTTGIPFYKGTRNCSMEIMKQMYDIASLLDTTDDLTWTAETYRRLGALEMEYRRMEGRDIRSVAEDTIATALCISTNGYGHEDDFRFYSDGITRVRNFIHTERYNMIGAVRDDAKAAYAAACALNNITALQGYENLEAKRVMDLDNPVPTVWPEIDFKGQEASGRYVCSICGYVYDPAEHDGVAFEDLPDDWRCPRCKQPKSKFNKA